MMIFKNLRIFSHLPLKSYNNVLNKYFIHISTPLSIKEIVEKKEGKVTIVEGVVSESNRTRFILKTPHDGKACAICRLDLQNLHYTDVLILSQFVRKDGCMLPRRVTGLCKQEQRRMSMLVSMAHIAGLMPNLIPSYSKKDCFKKRRDWKKYNTSFDPSTFHYNDPYFKDSSLKKEYYKSRGVPEEVIYEKSPERSPVIDLNVKKLTFY